MSKFNKGAAPYYDDYDSSKQYTHLLAIPGRVAQAREITQIQSTVKDIVKSIGDSILKDGNIVEGCQVIVNKYSRVKVSQVLTSNGDRVPLNASNVHTVVSIYQGDKQYTKGVDYSVVTEGGFYFIEWNGTSNHPSYGTPYTVDYTYDYSNSFKSATVTDGKVYLNGMVLPVSETTIAINGTGTETIGFRLMETLVTEEQDNSLRDPALGYDNFNQPGCHRIKSEVGIVKDDPDSAILVTLVDGEVAVERYASEYSPLEEQLARRTNDESGSYLVRGLNVRIEENKSDNSKFNVVVESGKAYVLGYELTKPAATRLTLPRSTTYSSVPAVIYHYRDNISMYELSSEPYVKSILSVRGRVQRVVNQQISHNTAEVMFEESVETSIQLISVTSQDGTISYTIGESATSGDCYLRRSGSHFYLKWNGTDNFPTLNTTYVVEYTFLNTFTQGTDYELSNSTHLSWIPNSNHPITDTDFYVDYEQYLARKDIVYIDQYGNVSAIQGTPAEYGFEVLPEAPVNTLALAAIMSPPSGDLAATSTLKIAVSNVGLTRFTMSDIQRLLERIRTIEYDQSILSLNEEARQYETSSTKRGIFTDPLIDFSKIDYYYNLHEGVAVDSNFPVYDATLDLTDCICYLPTISATYDAEYDSAQSTAYRSPRIATLSKSGESVVLSQMNATKSFLINPYSMFPQLPEISITPAVDNWIEESYIDVQASQTSEEIVETSTRHLYNTIRQGGYFQTYSTSSSSSKTTSTGTRVSSNTTESVVSERAITYIREREITVEGSQFPGNLDNIKCYFDGVEVPLTPVGDTLAGTVSGSVRANSAGRFQATFVIPPNVLTGIREVRLASDIEIDGYESSAFALYQASGLSRTIQRTVTTVTTILLSRVITVTTNTYVDPVGQTFVLDRMTMVSGIDLYFENKPEGTTPVTCDIREVVNGTIASTVYGHKTLSASEVKVSADSTVATRFTFEDPVLLEENKEYAFVVRSTSPSYRIWVADLGENDVQTGDPVLSNPYLIGVMMSSSNNSSWSTHQTTDVKFRLIEDTYNETSEVFFNKISSLEAFSRINLLAETIIPNGTSVDWQYSTDSGANYRSISPYNLVVLDQLIGDINLKAVLSRDSRTNLSPIIALDSVSTVLSCYDTEGYYISKNITGLDEYTHVDIVLDSYVSSGTGLDVFVSTGGSLVQATLDSDSNRDLNYGWREQTYKVDVTESTQCRVYIRLTSNLKYFTPSFRRLRVIMS